MSDSAAITCIQNIYNNNKTKIFLILAVSSIGTECYQYNRKKTSKKRVQRVKEWIEGRQKHQ